MYNFQYYVPTRVVFGKAAEEETGKQVKAQNGTFWVVGSD